MKPVERLEQATAPDGTVLTLYRHDGAYTIRVDGVELMSTRRHHSEDKLAELACAPLRDVADARVLIGGLGLGFTLRAALEALGPDASVVVVEIIGDVIEWNRKYRLGHAALDDPRVDLRHDDVANVLRGKSRHVRRDHSRRRQRCRRAHDRRKRAPLQRRRYRNGEGRIATERLPRLLVRERRSEVRAVAARCGICRRGRQSPGPLDVRWILHAIHRADRLTLARH